MALVHDLILISGGERTCKVGIPDDIIQYIYDSTLWVVSLWNENRLEYGLPYYGVALLKREGISKLKKIMKSWRTLFDLAPDEVILSGNYLYDEDRYEKIKYSKIELIKLFDQVIDLCERAEEIGADILYEGI